MELIIGLIVILGLVTVVGHGIWSLLALIFRGGKPRQPTPPLQPAIRWCVQCGRPCDPREKACPRCMPETALSEEKCLRIVEQQARRLQEAELLNDTAAQALQVAIEARRDQLHPEGRFKTVPPTPVVERPPPLPVLPLEAEAAVVVENQPDAESLAAPVEDTAKESEVFTSPPVAPPEVPSAPREPRPVSFVPPPLPARPVAVALPPAKPWTELLASFMEQKNIRWGELIGGLMIVGCSAALVASFWAQIAERPLLQFSVFTAVTGAFFGLGLYTEHRWKLPSTSRGILRIATLLVPLNFLAFAAFSRGGPRLNLVAIVGESVAFLLFGFLLRQAAKVIAPRWPMLLTLGVMGLSLCTLGVRYAMPDAGSIGIEAVLSVTTLTVLAYAAVNIGAMVLARRWPTFETEEAWATLELLAITSFTVAIPITLLMIVAPDPANALRWLAPLLSLLAACPMAVGLQVWRRCEAKSAAKMRIAGSAIAIFGALGMVGVVAIAWPHPAGMLPVALIDFLALSAVAWLFRVPAGHGLALACGLFAYLLGFHHFAGHIGWFSSAEELQEALWRPIGGLALALPVLLMLAATDWLRRLQQSGSAIAYFIAAVFTAVLSLLLSCTGGLAVPGDPNGLLWLLLGYGLLAFAVGTLRKHQAGIWVGWALLLSACAQWLASHHAGSSGWMTGLLGFATIALGCAWITRRPRPMLPGILEIPSFVTAVITSVSVVPLLAAQSLAGNPESASLGAAWLALLWLAIAIEQISLGWFAAGQLAIGAAALLAAQAWIQTRPWFAESPAPAIDARTWQAAATGLSLAGLLWGLLRLLLTPMLVQKFANAGEPGTPATEPSRPAVQWLRRLACLLALPWSVDRLISVVLIAALIGLSGVTVAPGIAFEFSARGFADPIGSWGPLYTHAAGSGSWLLLGFLLLILTGWWKEGRQSLSAIGLLLVTWTVCPLLAAQVPEAGSSALRWLFAGFLLAASALKFLQIRRLAVPPVPSPADDRRKPIMAIQSSFGLSPKAPPVRAPAALLSILLGALPIVALTLIPLIAAMTGAPLTGPAAELFFARIGPTLSYATPLAVIAGLLVAGAIGRISPVRILLAALVVNLAVSAAYGLSITLVGPMESVHWMRLAQLNIISISIYVLLWLLALSAGPIPLRLPPTSWPIVLRGLATVAKWAAAALIVPALIHLLLDPTAGAAADFEAGTALGCAALLLASIAAGWIAFTRSGGPHLPTIGQLIVALAGISAVAVASRGTASWAGYRTWMGTQTAAAWAMLALGSWLHHRGRGVVLSRSTPAAAFPVETSSPLSPTTEADSASPVPLGYERPDSPADPSSPSAVLIAGRDVREIGAQWAGALGAFAMFLAARGAIADPAGPWPAVAVIICLSLLTTAVAVWLLWPGYLFGSALLVNVGVSLWYVRDGDRLGSQGLLGLLEVNLIALSLPGLAWLLLELQIFRRSSALPLGRRPAAHQAVALIAWAGGLLLSALLIGNRWAGSPLLASPWLGWAALTSAGGLMFGCLWDRRARFALPGLYTFGLAACAMAVDACNLEADVSFAAFSILLAGYAVLTELIWQNHAALNRIGQTFGIPPEERPERVGRWLSAANACIAIFVAGSAVWSDFAFVGHHIRLATALAAVAQAGLIVVLPRPSARRGAVRVVLVAGLIGVVTSVWALCDPSADGAAIHRVAVVAVTLSLIAIAASLSFAKLTQSQSELATAVRRLVRPLIGFGLLFIGVALALEASMFTATGRVPIHPAAIGAVFFTIFACCAAAVRLGLRPAIDPFELSPRKRTIYIYAAEGLLAAALAHLRLTMPQLFGGPLQQWWPLVVMAIAFAGVGIGELLRRRGRWVVGEPLAYTGVLLPILPVLTWWLARSAVDYSTLLVSVGLLYGAVSVLRRSFAFMLVAAVAGNVALWFLLERYESLGFFAHPQLWVVPAALSFLAAGELNRDRLSAAQLRVLRYTCLSAVYVASTSDVLLAGAAQNPWLPMVLGAFAVGGVFAGMVMRVRAFLFLGTGFLLIAIVTMIRNAAINLQWAWIWYVAGIVLGVLILLVFALFEKKREQVLAMLEGLKKWE